MGWNFTEYEALGEDFQTRGSRQEEQITVLRKLWAEDLVTFHGRFHDFDQIGIAPRPKGQIPIWIGGGFREPLLKRVARFADGWIPLLLGGQDPAPVIDRLRYHLEQEGRDIASFGLQAQVSTPPGQETDWVKDAKNLRTLGFTHLGFGTLTRGFTPMENLDRADWGEGPDRGGSRNLK